MEQLGCNVKRYYRKYFVCILITCLLCGIDTSILAKPQQEQDTRLDFSGIKDASLISDSIIRLNKKYQLQIRILILDSCDLHKLPKEVDLLSGLRHVSLKGNPNLHWVGAMESLSRFQKLKFLNLSNNNLTHLPSGLKSLKRLSGLKLSFNELKISELDVPLNQLNSLLRLWIDHNALETFPSKLLEHPKLRYLYAFDNRISKIQLLDDPEHKRTNKLWVLHLGSNEFNILPVELTKIKGLRMAIFNQNQIFLIPTDFSFKNYSLSALILDGNELNQIQIERGNMFFKRFMMYSAERQQAKDN